MEAIWEWGIAIIISMQSASGLAPLWRGLSVLGDEMFFLFLLPLLFWCINPRLGIRVGLVLLLGTAVNSAIKLACTGPRPFWYSPQVQALTAESSFGLPSAHAQNTLGVWGVLAAWFKRVWVWVGVVLVALLVGLSRLALGVHFPSDVLVGWLLGGLVLAAFLSWADPIWQWFATHSLSRQIALTFLASLLLVAIPSLIAFINADWQIRADWAANAARALPDDPIAPLSLDTTMTLGGTWFGFIAGALVLWKKWGGLRVDGPLWQRGLRLLVGLVIVFLIWFGLGAIFPRDATLLAALLRYLRYTLLGSWISLGAPLSFQRLGLVQQAV